MSLDAPRWLQDLGAAFVQLDADGQVVTWFAPLGRDDPRLRPTRALAAATEAGVVVVRERWRTVTAGVLGGLD